MIRAHLVFIVAGLAGAMRSTGMIPYDAALAMVHAHLSVLVGMRSTMCGTIVRGGCHREAGKRQQRSKQSGQN